jgi:hypothetical protein
LHHPGPRERQQGLEPLSAIEQANALGRYDAVNHNAGVGYQ